MTQKKRQLSHFLNFDVFLTVELPKYWGTLCYVNQKGETITEKVPLEIGDYGLLYQNIDDAIQGKCKKLVSDEETIAVLDIVKKAENIARQAK